MKQHLNTLLICLAIIIGITILGNAYKYKFTSTETVSVTGLSEKDFTSDLIVWGGSFNRNAMELKDAYAALKQDETASYPCEFVVASNLSGIFFFNPYNREIFKKYEYDVVLGCGTNSVMFSLVVSVPAGDETQESRINLHTSEGNELKHAIRANIRLLSRLKQNRKALDLRRTALQT